MFDNAESISEELTPYAANPVAATIQSSKNQMRRMYPGVDLDKHPDSIMPLILDRTVHYMVHLDQKFDMNAIYDQSHFDKMKAESFVYLAWLESPDGTPFPAVLKYSSSIVTVDDDGEIIAPVSQIAAAPVAQAADDAQKVRALSKNSKFQKALVIYNEDQANRASRASTLQRMVMELEMNANTANVYYSKFKNPVKQS